MFSDCTSEESDSSGSSFLIWGVSSTVEQPAVYLTLYDINERKHIESKYKGNITEIECILAFMKLGYNVSIPYGDCERYDFVVDINNRLYKIQSKTSKSIDNGAAFKFSCRSCNRKDGGIVHHHYTKEEIDYFVTTFNGDVYLIPVEECKSDKRLRLEATKNGQERGVVWAKNYKLEEVINKIQADV